MSRSLPVQWKHLRREAAKKVICLMAVSLSPYPPPLKLNGIGTFSKNKKSPKKVIFFLMASPLHSLLMALPLKKELFLAASLNESEINYHFYSFNKYH